MAANELFGMPIVVNPALRDDILFGLVSAKDAAALTVDGKILLGGEAARGLGLGAPTVLRIPPVKGVPR